MRRIVLRWVYYLLIATIVNFGVFSRVTADETFGACTGPGANKSGWSFTYEDKGTFGLVTAVNTKKFTVEINTIHVSNKTPRQTLEGSGHVIWEIIGSCFHHIRKAQVDSLPRSERMLWNAANWRYLISVDFVLKGLNADGAQASSSVFQDTSSGTNWELKPWPQFFRERAKTLGNYGFQPGDDVLRIRIREENIGGIVFVLNGALTIGLHCVPIGGPGVSCEQG